MTRIDESAARRMLPRWRSFTAAVQSLELSPIEVSATEIGFDTDVVGERVTAWQREKTLSFAGDLLGSAFVLGDIGEVKHAAAFVLKQQAASRILKRVASSILAADTTDRETDGREGTATNEDTDRGRRIGQLRASLRLTPRNPIAWAQLAREYAIVGHAGHALRAIAVALPLAPNNRFVLRAAVRAYVHFGDPDTAWAILRRCPFLRTDPWLMAAEIGSAMVTGRTPRSVKDGRSILSSAQFGPSQTTELASALASLELDSGATRQARKLFHLAIVEANDNTIAQVEWAGRVGKMRIIEQDAVPPQQSHEALAWHSYTRGEWTSAYQSALAWLREEPFSSRPVQLATFVGSVLLEDYAGAEFVGMLGLAANPDDQTLLNNLAFTLASAGKPLSAVSVYNRMRPASLDRELAIAWLATGGLIQFRLGLPEAGRDYYRLAMDLAGRIGADGQKALASCYLAREERLAQTQSADETLREAVKLAENTKWSVAKIVAGRLCDLASERPLRTTLGSSVPNLIASGPDHPRLKRVPVL